MNDIITLNMLLELPNEILKKSAAYAEYTTLLRKEVFDKYDVKTLKKTINNQFNKLKDIKYSYNYYEETLSTVNNSIYEIVVDKAKYQDSKIEKLVNSTIDKQFWATKFYCTVLRIASKLTHKEAKYLVMTFFSELSEEEISTHLQISRNTLQNIKKSCLVKTWFELKNFDDFKIL